MFSKLFRKTKLQISSKLVSAKVQQGSELIEGYPFCATGRNGQTTFWMVKIGSTVDGLTTGGLVNLAASSMKEEQPELLKAKARSFETREWVEGYPFYAKAETEESSYWMIRDGTTIEDVLTNGLVNIIPETITYDI